MNLGELVERACVQTGEIGDRDGIDRHLIAQYANEGLLELTGGRVPAHTTVLVAGGCAELSDIPNFSQAIAIADESGREVNFTVGMGKLRAKDGAYTLSYTASPGLLLTDEDVPGIPERFHGALSDYATWRALSNVGYAQQPLAQTCLARFQLALASYARWLDGMLGARRIMNKYT